MTSSNEWMTLLRSRFTFRLSLRSTLAVDCVAGLNQISNDAQTPADDSLPFRELRQLRPERNLRRKVDDRANRQSN